MPQDFNREREEIEVKLNAMPNNPECRAVVKEYNRLLRLLGNVEDDEIVYLALIAYHNVVAK